MEISKEIHDEISDGILGEGHAHGGIPGKKSKRILGIILGGIPAEMA